MTNLDREFGRKVQEARRSRRISQTELAREVGCFQSAISALEQGDGRKLNDEAIEKISKKFGIPIIKPPETPSAANADFAPPIPPVPSGAARIVMHGFCPNPNCPSNHAYTVGEELFMKPGKEECDPVGGTYCVLCGEVLEKKCPSCGAPLNEGAVCTYCGNRYVPCSQV